MFDSFASKYVRANGVNLHCRIVGSGPPILLLHGHPQTHVIWHGVAEDLAKHFTVVAADLRGYGDSERPPASQRSENYSKRVMGLDQRELMRALGFDRFSVLAHDRGARVAHRMALDHPESISRMLLLDIAPTLAMYEQTNEYFARVYWHWFFLIRPAPLPESLIENDAAGYLAATIGARCDDKSTFTDSAYAEYLRCLEIPGTATAICEDYRASAGIDLEHDREDIARGKILECPLLVLWGRKGVIGKCFSPLDEWRKVASNVKGQSLDCGHYIPEEAPQELLQLGIEFLATPWAL